MPRPTVTDSNDTSQEYQQRLCSTTNILNSDLTNSSSSSDYSQQSPKQVAQQTNLLSTFSDVTPSNIFSSSIQEQNNTISSSSSVPTSHSNAIELNMNPNSMTTPHISPIQSLHSTLKPTVEDKGIQCIANKNHNENSLEQDDIETINDEQIITSRKINIWMGIFLFYVPFYFIEIDSEIKKRSRGDILSDNDNWTFAADR